MAQITEEGGAGSLIEWITIRIVTEGIFTGGVGEDRCVCCLPE